MLVKNEDDSGRARRSIEVEAEQFEWSFTYPELGVTTASSACQQGEKIELR